MSAVHTQGYLSWLPIPSGLIFLSFQNGCIIGPGQVKVADTTQWVFTRDGARWVVIQGRIDA
jgi:hypothetical protein